MTSSNSLRTYLLELGLTKPLSPELMNEGGYTKDGVYHYKWGDKYYAKERSGQKKEISQGDLRCARSRSIMARR
jgi:hypothetical protein